MSQEFLDSAQTIEASHPDCGKALRLLSNACSMVLTPEKKDEPFTPFMVMCGKRSIISEDFLEEEIDFFVQIVDQIDNNWLKARLADLIWLRQAPSNYRFALLAIDAYSTINFKKETWKYGCLDCWERGIKLSHTLGKSAVDHLDNIENNILHEFQSATKQDGSLCWQLVNILERNNLGQNNREMIAQKLEKLAMQFSSDGDWNDSREYYKLADKWFSMDSNKEKSISMKVALAEELIKEAEETPSHMLKNTLYEKAIQTYRTIPNTMRAQHHVNDRITELRRLLEESGEKSLSEMHQISTSDVDLSLLAENSRNSVSNKTRIEAFKALCNIHPGVDADETRKMALEQIREYPFLSSIQATAITPDGRVAAKRPGISLGNTSSQDDEIIISAEMTRNYCILINIIVSGGIYPGLDILTTEHKLCETDFIDLVTQSSIVPNDRKKIWTKALFAGYNKDFLTAVHLLVPQIEHIVRLMLKQRGVQTTNLDSKGIENENGLSSLMALQETEEILGKNLSFEIKSLFCDPFGPNLRNNIAHGLLDDDTCQSACAIYAWWFGLKLVLNGPYTENFPSPA